MSGERWLPALDVRVAAAAADRMAGLLWQAGTSGIEEREDGILRAHFTASPPAALLIRLRQAGAGTVRRLRIPVEDWVAMGRAHVRAVRVGAILVRPPWSRSRPRAGEHQVIIDPARAFGTANHESTRLVLGALAARLPRGKAVLDVGCGSGVLALAALRLGADRAVACDVDPEAVLASRENAVRNRLGRRLVVQSGGAGDVTGRYGIVLANLTAGILATEAAAITDRVASGGWLIVAGFLRSEAASVGERFAALGLLPHALESEGEWVALVLSRPARSRR